MITSVFSIFDPSSSLINLSWCVLISPLLVIPFTYGNTHSTYSVLIENANNSMASETGYLLHPPKNGNVNVISTLIIIVLTLNAVALFPESSAATAHLTINLPLAVLLWATTLVFGLTNHFKMVMAHTVPQGTPTILINFMVLIEITSNLIRPITLCVRLTANIIAGHLLISLLSSFIIGLPTTTHLLLSMTPIILTTLESAVALIQAYVFATLVTLYAAETQ